MLKLDDERESKVFDALLTFPGSVGEHQRAWAYVIRKGDDLEYVPMPLRPCYGEMRRYGKESTRPNDPKPGDLTRPIKKGIREAVALRFILNWSPEDELINFLFDYKESPWRKVLSPELHFVADSNGLLIGVATQDTDVDPTGLVSLFMAQRMVSTPVFKESYELFRKDLGFDKTKALFMTQFFDLKKDYYLNGTVIRTPIKEAYEKRELPFSFHSKYAYFLSPNISPSLFREGQMNHELSGCKTWRDQEDYNRPQLSDLFLSKENVRAVFKNKWEERFGPLPGQTFSSMMPTKQLSAAIEFTSTFYDEWKEPLQVSEAA